MKNKRLHFNEKRNRLAYCFFFLLCALSFLSAQEIQIPIVKDPVTDLTNTLNQSEYSALRSKILNFEDSTSNQILILLLPTLGENEIRDFGIEVLKQNKIGQKGKDNGVLILVAKDDHKMSIEVGYGLEGVLTDALTNDIIRNQMTPAFRENDFYGGLDAAVTSIIAVSRGEYKANKKKQRDDTSWVGFFIIAAVLFFSLLSSIRNKKYGVSSRGYRSSNNWWWWGGGGGLGGGSSWGSFGGGGGGGSWSGGGGSFGGGGSSGSW